MPRHRVKNRPQHRAQRPGIWPGRGARSAAGQRESSSRPASGIATSHGATSHRPEYGRMLRGVMLTPWFAVSVGIVIAASLTLTSPHAALTFPPSKSGQCAEVGCTSGGGPRLSGPLPAIKREVKLHVSEKRYAKARSDVQVDYELLPRRREGFMAVVVIIGQRALGKWSLRFVLPGAQIHSIMWAKWQPDGSGGVVVEGSPLPWPRSGANEARIVILGTGTPGWPGGCVLDGANCTFRSLGSDAGRARRWATPGD